MRLGFIGLGTMGGPMARNLAQKAHLAVWNRSPAKYAMFEQAGAVSISIASTPAKVAESSDMLFMMLFDTAAIECILDDDFRRAVRGKIIVNASSIPVDSSKLFCGIIQEAGGRYLEMPVSGSKVPAKKSSSLKTKYTINTLATTLTAGLAESMSLAEAQGLDLAAFAQVLMASAFSKIKVNKILNEDWSPQASVRECYNSTQLIKSAAETEHVQMPLMDVCGKLYTEAIEADLAEEDMIAIIKQIRSRKKK
ncbi:NAD(P)-dependent oxidoreductase [Aspergillus puulaauensis]|uniref:NAD(P)-dependent oxidoreductase n=1 Tax=Aspergillus puulaauensis TaxID=1220207 RepID=A0A7R7XEC8_9EURO|nr:uncharacterized protein APUU_20299A [Aspergillus puulaauensis]BCS19867.1 hypothetical protein APUU_20299A [Aspergillus puulaauensis]